MLAGRRKILAVDIGSHSIKALEVTSTGSFLQVQDFECVDIPSPEERLGTLRRFVQEHRLGGSPTISAVSGRNVIVKTVFFLADS